MTTLISLVIFSIIVALFATQNTSTTSINVMNHLIKGIPTYLIILISLLLGMLVSSVINVINTISSKLTIRGKNNAIRQTQKTIDDLQAQITALKTENDDLRAEQNMKVTEEFHDAKDEVIRSHEKHHELEVHNHE